MRSIAILSSFLSLLLASCGSPLIPPTPLPVDTAVALTLQAISAAATPAPNATAAPAATAAPDALPHDLYFRNWDDKGIWQIFRLQPNGRTVDQITFELADVDAYGISPMDGGIAYVSNNQMFVVDAAGAGRRLLVDGGVIDTTNPWLNALSAPVWSPDGRTIAYGHGGLNFVDPQSGTSHRVLENQVDSSPGFPLIKETYSARAFSADGTRLLLDIGYWEGGTFGVFFPVNNALVRFEREDGAIICCRASWIPDGTGVYITSPVLGMAESGLFHADAASGAVSILLPGAAPDGTYNFADAALVGPDNQLYFFFNNLPEIPADGRTPLFLVRSAPDGVTGRMQLLPDTFRNVNEILWDPSADVVAILTVEDPYDNYGGMLQLIYLDGRASLNPIPYARDLRWGR